MLFWSPPPAPCKSILRGDAVHMVADDERCSGARTIGVYTKCVRKNTEINVASDTANDLRATKAGAHASPRRCSRLQPSTQSQHADLEMLADVKGGSNMRALAFACGRAFCTKNIPLYCCTFAVFCSSIFVPLLSISLNQISPQKASDDGSS